MVPEHIRAVCRALFGMNGDDGPTYFVPPEGAIPVWDDEPPEYDPERRLTDD